MAKEPSKIFTFFRTLPKEFYGVLSISCGLFIALSLSSFHIFRGHTNWLGLMGYGSAYALLYTWGLAAYFIPPFLIWAGIEQFLSTSTFSFKQKSIFFLLVTASFSILLTVLGHSNPLFPRFFEDRLYIDYLSQRSYIGGLPFYNLYIGYSAFNLNTLLGSVGTFLIFFVVFFLSGCLLSDISPVFAFQLLKKTIFKLCVFAYHKSIYIGGKILRSSFWRLWKKSPKTTLEPVEEVNSSSSSYSTFNRQHPLQLMRHKVTEIPLYTSQKNSTKEDYKEEEEPVKKESYGWKKESSKDTCKEKDRDHFEPPAPALQAPIATVTSGTSISKEERRQLALQAQRSFLGDFKDYKLPPVSLLTQVKKIDPTTLKNDLRKHAEILEETLLSFGIEAKVGEIHCGPTITSFEVHPAVGVKVQKIKALENDIALNMQAKSIRIIAPIPGKAAVGIEVPNPRPQEVSFREMLEFYQQSDKKMHIPILLGKMVNGDDVFADLTKMPHCIIAGATGSGKSVCINTIVMSILMNARPDEIKLVMVDPKKVELTAYSQLPHMLAPVITEPHGASAALNWLVKEMEHRYEILRQLGVRNILAFNHRQINKELESTLEFEIPEKLPYIVVIIDELADLMMVSSSDIETPIARIAQMARAVGIHLILATQRPSREVITGLIKANFPTRIAFKVASRVNSQIIIDESGAESLLGNGDLLFLPPGASSLVRAQGAFIRDEDINRTIQFISTQAPANYIIPSFDTYKGSKESSTAKEESGLDSLYDQAKAIVLETGNASTTFLQRKLKMGYARAASLMDQLEERGIIGPQEGAKPRKIFYPSSGSSIDSSLESDDEEDFED